MQVLNQPHKTYSLDSIEAATQTQTDGRTIGIFKEFALHSHFQPIFSLAHRRAVGYEALVRPYGENGEFMPPNLLFQRVLENDDIVELDRLCRDIHLRNFAAMSEPTQWLFLNVNARVALEGKHYGPYFEALLQRHAFPAHRIVIEILENDIKDEQLLAETVAYYASLGCLIAIDDFGAGHSNFERIWRISPHIVKLDRTMLIQAREKVSVRRVLPSLIALLHETGCLTLIEGVETQEEALIALDSGVDFVQGFLFGRPLPQLLSQTGCTSQLFDLCNVYQAHSDQIKTQNQARLKPYLQAFRNCTSLIGLGADPIRAAEQLLAFPNVLRCFLLDESGHQLGSSLFPTHVSLVSDARFIPVSDTFNATWSRRHYFSRAMSEPGKVHISRPYLSVSDAKMCVTLSIALLNADQRYQVFCTDILADPL